MNIKYLLTGTALILSIIYQPGHTQVLRSGKSSIYVDTKGKNTGSEKIAPVISIISPELNEGDIYQVKDKELNVIGKATDADGIKTLFVNARPVTLAEGDVFVSRISLAEGENDLSVIAMDKLGNYTEANYIIKYTPEIIFRTINGKGDYYALLIGVDEYMDPAIPDLENPVRDAVTLKEILTSKYTFQDAHVTLLRNARQEDIILALDGLAGRLDPDDNLLIFYAGHGWWDQTANLGYWLPSDAEQANKTAWFRNSTLCDYLKEINSKHTLLVADACFGGSIFKTRSVFSDADKAINKLYELPSRKAMTSGTLTEVPDRSAFTRFLLERLSENTEKYLSSEQLFSSFRIAVINNSDAVPQYGEIKDVGDEGGDFIFIREFQK